jgi:cytochrome P450
MMDFADRWGFSSDRFWLRGKQPPKPVEFDEEAGRWNVYGYPELVEIFDDTVGLTPDSTRLADLPPEAAQYVDGDLAQLTGPEHTHARKRIGRWFTPKNLADLDSQVHRVARGLLTDLADRDQFDVLNDFVEEITAIVFSELLGTPVEQRDMLRIKDEAMDYEGVQGEEGYFEGLVAPLLPLREFLGEAIDACAKDPKGDLFSWMVEFRKLDGGSMSRDEIINFGISILGAGRLATPMLLGNALLCLESFPDQAAKVRADAKLVPAMLEETMRFISPANISSRATNVDVRIGGVTIPKDQLVMMWIGPGNRDPREFADPNTFDVTRQPNRHLGYGRGAHYCLGAQMVRIQARIMFNLLTEHFPNLHVDPDVPPVFFGSPEFTGPSALTVRATATALQAAPVS